MAMPTLGNSWSTMQVTNNATRSPMQTVIVSAYGESPQINLQFPLGWVPAQDCRVAFPQQLGAVGKIGPAHRDVCVREELFHGALHTEGAQSFRHSFKDEPGDWRCGLRKSAEGGDPLPCILVLPQRVVALSAQPVNVQGSP